jgi:hypothetical protein
MVFCMRGERDKVDLVMSRNNQDLTRVAASQDWRIFSASCPRLDAAA